MHSGNGILFSYSVAEDLSKKSIASFQHVRQWRWLGLNIPMDLIHDKTLDVRRRILASACCTPFWSRVWLQLTRPPVEPTAMLTNKLLQHVVINSYHRQIHSWLKNVYWAPPTVQGSSPLWTGQDQYIASCWTNCNSVWLLLSNIHFRISLHLLHSDHEPHLPHHMSTTRVFGRKWMVKMVTLLPWGFLLSNVVNHVVKLFWKHPGWPQIGSPIALSSF